jgi:hypothetical protein
VIARPTGEYKAPVGSLESRILDDLYDRRQGRAVTDTIRGMLGYWYEGDPHEWVLQVVRHHVLASACLRGGSPDGVDPSQIKKLEPAVSQVERLLDEFGSANAAVVAALADSVQRGLTGRKV